MSTDWTAPLQDLYRMWRELDAARERPIHVVVVGEPGSERDNLMDHLLFDSPHPHRLLVADPHAEAVPVAELYLVLAGAERLRAARECPPAHTVAIVPGAARGPVHARAQAVRQSLELPADRVLPLLSWQDLPGALADLVVAHHGDLVMPLSQQFPLLRVHLARWEVRDTAKQNGLLGLLPVPGADMPLMTANQLKMLLRIAALFGHPVDWTRSPEGALIVGGGYGLRNLVRWLAQRLPGPKWLLGSLVGYAGTLAVGHGAIAYYRNRAGSMPPSPGWDQPEVVLVTGEV